MGRSFVPPATETFGYDSDGNLTSDGRWTAYVWDGENRLVEMRRDGGLLVDPAEAKAEEVGPADVQTETGLGRIDQAVMEVVEGEVDEVGGEPATDLALVFKAASRPAAVSGARPFVGLRYAPASSSPRPGHHPKLESPFVPPTQSPFVPTPTRREPAHTGRLRVSPDATSDEALSIRGEVLLAQHHRVGVRWLPLVSGEDSEYSFDGVGSLEQEFAADGCVLKRLVYLVIRLKRRTIVIPRKSVPLFLLGALPGCDIASGVKYVAPSAMSVGLESHNGRFLTVPGNAVLNGQTMGPQENLLYVLVVCPGLAASGHGTGTDHQPGVNAYTSFWETPNGEVSVTVKWDKRADTVSIGEHRYQREAGSAFVIVWQPNGVLDVTQLPSPGPDADAKTALGFIQKRMTNDALIAGVRLMESRSP